MVTPPVGDMTVVNPDEVVELDCDVDLPIIGAANVAPAPISPTSKGTMTAWMVVLLARRWALLAGMIGANASLNLS